MFQCQLIKTVLTVLQRKTGFIHISVQRGNGMMSHFWLTTPCYHHKTNAGANSTSQ
jgi:hypothetical protein